MIENEKNNRDLVFSYNNSEPIGGKGKKIKEIERNTFSLEPLERKKSKIFAEVNPYLQQQSINEKDNIHHYTRKDTNTMPKLNKMPSKKFERKNSIEKCKVFIFLV